MKASFVPGKKGHVARTWSNFETELIINYTLSNLFVQPEKSQTRCARSAPRMQSSNWSRNSDHHSGNKHGKASKDQHVKLKCRKASLDLLAAKLWIHKKRSGNARLGVRTWAEALWGFYFSTFTSLPFGEPLSSMFLNGMSKRSHYFLDVKSRLNYWESLIKLFEVANEVNKNITLVETEGPVFGVVLGETTTREATKSSHDFVRRHERVWAPSGWSKGCEQLSLPPKWQGTKRFDMILYVYALLWG